MPRLESQSSEQLRWPAFKAGALAAIAEAAWGADGAAGAPPRALARSAFIIAAKSIARDIVRVAVERVLGQEGREDVSARDFSPIATLHTALFAKHTRPRS